MTRRAVVLSADMQRAAATADEPRLKRWIMDPLRGKTSLGRVVGWYGIAGSLLYSVFGLFIDVDNQRAMQAYTIGGLVYSVYVTVATYQCAASMRSALGRNLVRASAVLSLVLLPLLAYLALSGALTLTSLGGIE
jgi:hypothetical protein